MPEMTIIPADELTHLKERARKLSLDKSYLQLIISLMNKVSAAQGLENMIEALLINILDVLGGANIVLYYQNDDELYYADIFGKRLKLERIDDELVRTALESGKSIEHEHSFGDTQMLTQEFSKAYTWVFPLLAGTERIGVIKLESLHIGMHELYGSLPTFFSYVAIILKNSMGAEALRKSERKFHAIFDQTFQFIGLLTTNGVLIEANKSSLEFSGITEAEALNRKLWETPWWKHSQEERDLVQQAVQKAAQGEFIRFETTHQAVDGSLRYIDFSIKPVLDEAGVIVLLLPEGRDITDRKRDEEAIHIQAVELEQEVAERQMAQESLQLQTVMLEEEIEKRQKAQEELEKLNDNLEQLVQERTAELNERNSEVQQAYDDLKRVQGQLLQQDKMAAVGQLAAGVAHEINNPMGFIISNLGSLGKYVGKMTAYLAFDEQLLAGCAPEIRDMAARERQKYKIDHICRDMPDLISESSDGAQRVRKIVQDLKNFSRIDNVEFVYADINEGLESTISIAWNELKYKTAIIREYGQLPQVWCNPGQLNQVFLNILVNAAHAIEEQGEIRIETRAEEGTVKISISDTGSGIAPENVKRIFDPFFTTKEVGKGTGLGLAIAYDIITNKHNGRIEVRSEVGKGSTFTIALPTKNKNNPDKGGDLHELPGNNPRR
jgi:PAS domain S-box-containing protein